MCIESETSDVNSASNLTKLLRRRGRAQEGLSVLVKGKVCVDCTPHYIYANLVCIESETSGVNNLTKPLRRRGVAELRKDCLASLQVDCVMIVRFSTCTLTLCV